MANQLCPSDSGAFDGGVSGSSDTWVPVADDVDKWLQLGEHSGSQCITHHELSLSWDALDPHPCHTHSDPARYPDDGGCVHSAVYCCGASFLGNDTIIVDNKEGFPTGNSPRTTMLWCDHGRLLLCTLLSSVQSAVDAHTYFGPVMQDAELWR